jgi:aspartate aminotransferase
VTLEIALRVAGIGWGDEVIVPALTWVATAAAPVWVGAVPVFVDVDPETYCLDATKLEAAIGPRTRLVIVNTPHNPTGRIYGRDELAGLAEVLERASRRIGRRVFLLSDEPYRRIRFDGRAFTSPAVLYPWTLVSYSYGKVLLAPGQRLGYLAISPLMPTSDRQQLRDVMFASQMALGWCFPNAVMQYAVPHLERLSIDVAALARRRDALSEALGRAGHEVLPPEGTFYLWVRWAGDPARQWEALADHGVFVMPGTLMKHPGYFRISLTASDAMVAQALPHLARSV